MDLEKRLTEVLLFYDHKVSKIEGRWKQASDALCNQETTNFDELSKNENLCNR